MGTKTIVSWETPPKPDQKFSVYTNTKRVFVAQDLESFEKIKDTWLDGDEISGWLPVDVSDKAPPFLSASLPKQIAANKDKPE